ncbi:MAG: IS200/IS605 family transposase [Rhodospirillales bacterium]|nr:MAG: IS200/IS605 family transposase [Rhodospirillales bacterium]
MSDYRKTQHCVYVCDYHLILPTKYRREIINPGLFGYLKRKLLEIATHYPRMFFKTMYHGTDHLHLLVSIPPQMSVGSVVRLIKTNTARGLKQQFPFLKAVYWGTDSIWSEGYFVSTVGINESVIRQYIELQGKEDAGQTARLFESA